MGTKTIRGTGNSSTGCWYEALLRDPSESLGCSKVVQVDDDDSPLFLMLTSGKVHSIKKKKSKEKEGQQNGKKYSLYFPFDCLPSLSPNKK